MMRALATFRPLHATALSVTRSSWLPLPSFCLPATTLPLATHSLRCQPLSTFGRDKKNFPRNKGAVVFSDGERAEFAKVRQWVINMVKEEIPRNTYELSFSKSSGPGGQNVNKLSTKAELRFNVQHAWIPSFTRRNLELLHKSRINQEGTLVLHCQDHRTQQANVTGVFTKLKELLLECSQTPAETSEKKLKKIAKIERAANEKRIQAKKRRSDMKKRRSGRGVDD
jgi:peptidyl-tRNA hydrolase ICT1